MRTKKRTSIYLLLQFYSNEMVHVNIKLSGTWEVFTMMQLQRQWNKVLYDAILSQLNRLFLYFYKERSILFWFKKDKWVSINQSRFFHPCLFLLNHNCSSIPIFTYSPIKYYLESFHILFANVATDHHSTRIHLCWIECWMAGWLLVATPTCSSLCV